MITKYLQEIKINKTVISKKKKKKKKAIDGAPPRLNPQLCTQSAVMATGHVVAPVGR